MGQNQTEYEPAASYLAAAEAFKTVKILPSRSGPPTGFPASPRPLDIMGLIPNSKLLGKIRDQFRDTVPSDRYPTAEECQKHFSHMRQTLAHLQDLNSNVTSYTDGFTEEAQPPPPPQDESEEEAEEADPKMPDLQ